MRRRIQLAPHRCDQVAGMRYREVKLQIRCLRTSLRFNSAASTHRTQASWLDVLLTPNIAAWAPATARAIMRACSISVDAAGFEPFDRVDDIQRLRFVQLATCPAADRWCHRCAWRLAPGGWSSVIPQVRRAAKLQFPGQVGHGTVQRVGRHRGRFHVNRSRLPAVRFCSSNPSSPSTCPPSFGSGCDWRS